MPRQQEEVATGNLFFLFLPELLPREDTGELLGDRKSAPASL